MGRIRPFFICSQMKSILCKTQEIFIREKMEDREKDVPQLCFSLPSCLYRTERYCLRI